jgi:phosphoribosylaminoimidazolecarboxamide formyltransferase/IMP cyclohydrolase
VDARVAVLASGSGTNLQALLDDPVVGPRVAVVVSDREASGALGRAAGVGVKAVFLDPADHPSREGYDEALLQLLRDEAIDVVCLAGFMRILSPTVVRAFWGRMLNVHPSLLPAFPGARAPHDTLAWGAKLSGVTVHLVDEQVDHGPIVYQEPVPVLEDDDERSLHARIQQVEHRIYPQAVRLLLEGSVRIDGRRVTIARAAPAAEAAGSEATAGELRPIRRALLSVSDKEGLAEFARGLAELGARLVSTGSTARVLREAGLDVAEVSDVTGSPEMLDGRVKTLHPAIHAGILADATNPQHVRELEARGIEPFDLVAVNLYPFERTVTSGGTQEEAVEQIDIGGPTLVRAAAKNFRSVAVVVRPERYADVLAAARDRGGTDLELRRALAEEAFGHVALYDAAIVAWFAGPVAPEELPTALTMGFQRIRDLRYGENPHQRAGLYRTVLSSGPLGGALVLQGKEMSFNNWLDTDAARAVAGSLDGPAVAIVKHHNPCGAAVATSMALAYRAALASDPVSAYGGVVAFNGEVDQEAAEAMADVFTEVVVAPGFSAAALAAFAERKNLRVVQAEPPPPPGLEVRPIEGGALVQEDDSVTEGRDEMKVASKREPEPGEWADLVFAWRVAARVKSNAIVLAAGSATVGVGAGQMSRVDAVDIACRKAGDRAAGSVMASDAFFPFRDGIDLAARAGVRAVIQPGGSVRDEEVVAAADEHGLAMVLTGRRHFRH